MAKVVAPGHLRFKDDEKLDLHPKKSVLNVKSKKNFNTDQKKGIACRTQKAVLNVLTNKTPPTPSQTESSSTINNLPKDTDTHDEEFLWDEFDHSICCKQQGLCPEEDDPFMKYGIESLQDDPDDWKLKVPDPPKPSTIYHRLLPPFQGLPDMDVDHITTIIPHE